MGGAARSFKAAATLRGRWKIHTLSWRSTAIVDTVPMTQLLGNFGQAGSTSKTGIFAEGAGAWARLLTPSAPQSTRTNRPSHATTERFEGIVCFSNGLAGLHNLIEPKIIG